MKLFIPLTRSHKDNCKLCGWKKISKHIQGIDMICEMCKKYISVDYRVKNTRTSGWIFVCKKCLLGFSKTDGYKYGGTRKENRRKKVKIKNTK